MKFLTTVTIVLCTLSLSAQVKYNSKLKVDAEVQSLYDQALQCIKEPDKDCRGYFNELINYGKKNKVAYMDLLYFQYGYFFDTRFNYDSALFYTKKAYELADKNNPNSAYPLILNSLGANYFRTGDYDKATKYMLMTAKVEEEQDRPLYAAYAYNNLGTVMGINENYDEAVRYFKKGYQALEKVRDTTIIANLIANVAIYLKKANDLPEARKWAIKAIEAGNRYHSPSAVAYGNYVMGTTEKDTNSSLAFLQKAVEKGRESGNKSVLADALDIYSVKLSEKNRHDQAKKGIEEAIRLHTESDYTTGLKSAYANAGHIYYNAGDYKKSSEYYSKYEELYRKILSDDNKKRVNELTAKYETEKKEKLIAEQQLKIQKQRTIQSYGILGGALLLTVIGAAYLINRRAQKQRLVRLQQEKENAILNSFILGEERERKRISHELHDGVAAMIGAAKMSIESIPHLTKEKQLEQLSKVKGILDSTHADVRHIAHNLLPTVLEKEGLVNATSHFAFEINETKLLNISVTDNESNANTLAPQLQLMLFRVIQELMNNIIKHSQAQNVDIVFRNNESGFQIEISDDGVGYDYDSATENQGLYSISQRLKSIGGNFIINRRNIGGTQAKLEVAV